MSEATVGAARRYGNLRRPARPGLFGFGAVATAVGFVGLFATLMINMSYGLGAAAVSLAVTALALLPTRRSRRDGWSGYERFGNLLLARTNRASGKELLLQGAVGLTPDGKCRLPGLLAQSELHRAKDPYGGTFAVLIVPATQHYTVVFECAATGLDLVDEDVIDAQVAQWGGFLALTGEMSDVAGVQVVIETAPDTGHRLRQAVLSNRAENVSEFASRVMDDVVASYPVGSATIVTRLAVTFAGRHGGKRTPKNEMFASIANRLPTLLASLQSTGAGSAATIMQPEDLCDAVRVAFDPDVAEDVEEARRDPDGTGITWSDAGPTRLRPYDDRLRHDRAWSKSWHMVEPPTGAFMSNQLARLLSPHPDIPRKRIALVYRPHDQISAAAAVERDISGTSFTASSQRRPSARALRDLRAAQQTADEEAAGAGLIRFGMLLTITTRHAEDLETAESAFQQLRASARLRLRPALGNQEVAFTASLPCGLVLPEHTKLPPEMADYL